MAYVMDDSGEDACGETIIEAHGVAHRITFEVDHIKQEPKITHTTKPSKVVKGTRITVTLPRIDYCGYSLDIIDYCERRFLALAESYAWLNPHLTLKVKWHGKVRINIKASNPNWKKWLPSWPTCPHWYDVSRFRRYMAAHIANRATITVREFISEFRGMTGPRSRKPCWLKPALRMFRCIIFLDCIKPTPRTFRSCWPHLSSTPSRCALPISASSGKSISLPAWKRRAVIPKHSRTIDASAKPMACRASIEFAFGIHRDGLTAGGRGPDRKFITGVNWSPGINNPFRSIGKSGEGLDAILENVRASHGAPVIGCLHLACPRVAYTDRGKSAIVVEGEVEEDDDGEE